MEDDRKTHSNKLMKRKKGIKRPPDKPPAALNDDSNEIKKLTTYKIVTKWKNKFKELCEGNIDKKIKQNSKQAMTRKALEMKSLPKRPASLKLAQIQKETITKERNKQITNKEVYLSTKKENKKLPRCYRESSTISNLIKPEKYSSTTLQHLKRLKIRKNPSIVVNNRNPIKVKRNSSISLRNYFKYQSMVVGSCATIYKKSGTKLDQSRKDSGTATIKKSKRPTQEHSATAIIEKNKNKPKRSDSCNDPRFKCPSNTKKKSRTFFFRRIKSKRISTKTDSATKMHDSKIKRPSKNTSTMIKPKVASKYKSKEGMDKKDINQFESEDEFSGRDSFRNILIDIEDESNIKSKERRNVKNIFNEKNKNERGDVYYNNLNIEKIESDNTLIGTRSEIFQQSDYETDTKTEASVKESITWSYSDTCIYNFMKDKKKQDKVGLDYSMNKRNKQLKKESNETCLYKPGKFATKEKVAKKHQDKQEYETTKNNKAKTMKKSSHDEKLKDKQKKRQKNDETGEVQPKTCVCRSIKEIVNNEINTKEKKEKTKPNPKKYKEDTCIRKLGSVGHEYEGSKKIKYEKNCERLVKEDNNKETCRCSTSKQSKNKDSKKKEYNDDQNENKKDIKDSEKTSKRKVKLKDDDIEPDITRISCPNKTKYAEKSANKREKLTQPCNSSHTSSKQTKYEKHGKNKEHIREEHKNNKLNPKGTCSYNEKKDEGSKKIYEKTECDVNSECPRKQNLEQKSFSSCKNKREHKQNFDTCPYSSDKQTKPDENMNKSGKDCYNPQESKKRGKNSDHKKEKNDKKIVLQVKSNDSIDSIEFKNVPDTSVCIKQLQSNSDSENNIPCPGKRKRPEKTLFTVKSKRGSKVSFNLDCSVEKNKPITCKHSTHNNAETCQCSKKRVNEEDDNMRIIPCPRKTKNADKSTRKGSKKSTKADRTCPGKQTKKSGICHRSLEISCECAISGPCHEQTCYMKNNTLKVPSGTCLCCPTKKRIAKEGFKVNKRNKSCLCCQPELTKIRRKLKTCTCCPPNKKKMRKGTCVCCKGKAELEETLEQKRIKKELESPPGCLCCKAKEKTVKAGIKISNKKTCTCCPTEQSEKRKKSKTCTCCPPNKKKMKKGTCVCCKGKAELEETLEQKRIKKELESPPGCLCCKAKEKTVKAGIKISNKKPCTCCPTEQSEKRKKSKTCTCCPTNKKKMKKGTCVCCKGKAELEEKKEQERLEKEREEKIPPGTCLCCSSKIKALEEGDEIPKKKKKGKEEPCTCCPNEQSSKRKTSIKKSNTCTCCPNVDKKTATCICCKGKAEAVQEEEEREQEREQEEEERIEEAKREWERKRPKECACCICYKAPPPELGGDKESLDLLADKKNKCVCCVCPPTKVIFEGRSIVDEDDHIIFPKKTTAQEWFEEVHTDACVCCKCLGRETYIERDYEYDEKDSYYEERRSTSVRKTEIVYAPDEKASSSIVVEEEKSDDVVVVVEEPKKKDTSVEEEKPKKEKSVKPKKSSKPKSIKEKREKSKREKPPSPKTRERDEKQKRDAQRDKARKRKPGKKAGPKRVKRRVPPTRNRRIATRRPRKKDAAAPGYDPHAPWHVKLKYKIKKWAKDYAEGQKTLVTCKCRVKLSKRQELSAYQDDYRPFFRDGKRAIDLIVVVKDDGDRKADALRLKFLVLALKIGLEFELENGIMPINNQMIFIKVHAPEKVMQRYSEAFAVRKYFREQHLACTNYPERTFLMIVRNNYVEPRYLSTLERSLIVYKILLHIPYGPKFQDYGIHKLISRRIFRDAYALHDGPSFLMKGQEPTKATARQILFHNWAYYGQCLRAMPLTLIQEYMGERVAYYFAFAVYYNRFLFIHGAFSVLFWLLSVMRYFGGRTKESKQATDFTCAANSSSSSSSSSPSGLRAGGGSPDEQQVEEPGICPECLDPTFCGFKDPALYCKTNKYFYRMVDDGKLIFYSMFVCFWAIVFAYKWKSREKKLYWKWENSKALSRAELKPMYRKLPAVLRDRGRHCAYYTRLCCTSFLMIACVAGWMAFAYLYINADETIKLVTDLIQLVVIENKIIGGIFEEDQLQDDIVTVVRLLFMAMFFSLFAVIFGFVLKWIAYFLTSCEGHTVYCLYERSLARKLFFISMCTAFPYLVYHGIYKTLGFDNIERDRFLPPIRVYLKPFETWINFMDEIPFVGRLVLPQAWVNCGAMGSCLHQLFGVYIGVWFIFQCIYPLLKYIFRWLFNVKDWRRRVPAWESEYLLPPLTDKMISDRYDFLITQYALCTFFVTAFPFTPLLSALMNLYDFRYSARLFLCAHRRPLFPRFAGIGTWRTILSGVAFVTVFFNAYMIAAHSSLAEDIGFYTVWHEEPFKNYTDFLFQEYELKGDDSKYKLKANVSAVKGKGVQKKALREKSGITTCIISGQHRTNFSESTCGSECNNVKRIRVKIFFIYVAFFAIVANIFYLISESGRSVGQIHIAERRIRRAFFEGDQLRDGKDLTDYSFLFCPTGEQY